MSSVFAALATSERSREKEDTDQIMAEEIGSTPEELAPDSESQEISLQKVETTYDANQLQVLEGLAAVRRHPAMYVGGNDAKGLFHIFKEVCDNAIDEALAGHCDRVYVAINEDGSVTLMTGTTGLGTGAHTALAQITAEELGVKFEDVAVVHGDAIAGGNELALHCDIVVASQTARFGMSLAQVGLAPNWFLAKKLMEVLGPVTTREMLLLGDPLPATKLHALGLIARCVPADQLEAEAAKVIGRLANNAPLSLKAMKALTVRQLEIRDHIKHDDVDALVVAAMQSQDAQEGMKARLEKRTAKFQGK